MTAEEDLEEEVRVLSVLLAAAEEALAAARRHYEVHEVRGGEVQ